MCRPRESGAKAGTHNPRRSLGRRGAAARILTPPGSSTARRMGPRFRGDDLKRLRSRPVAPTRWALLFGTAHQLDTRLGGLRQAAVGGEIVERHAARGESRLELFPDRMSAQGGKAIDRGNRADFILHDEA